MVAPAAQSSTDPFNQESNPMNRRMPRRSRPTMTPGLDRLESRQLLSNAAPHLRGLTTAAPAIIFLPPRVEHHPIGLGASAIGHGLSSVGSPPTSLSVALSGSVHGAARMQGTATGLTGSGTVGPLGAVTSTGTLTATGAEPVVYSGNITLVSSTGSVTVALSGRQFGPSRLGQPIALTYTITGGTGTFQGAIGSGHASFALNISRAGPGFVLTFGS
jgi:hypothetical protein